MFNEAEAVEVVRGLEREERAHAHNDGAAYFIANVEVVVSEANRPAGGSSLAQIVEESARCLGMARLRNCRFPARTFE
jgi:hypothetical protein